MLLDLGEKGARGDRKVREGTRCATFTTAGVEGNEGPFDFEKEDLDFGEKRFNCDEKAPNFEEKGCPPS